ncbi:MAG: hypothetical protein ASARMPREDX12_008147 [Alectoria sarmentosa]|nr:MAG: hypothetical protein ASARMPREDX12_008147 [Alectoria sarmentosa]
MPTTLLTLPRELRDEIYTYVALSSSFTFLLASRQLHEEGTPLLYKHGTYRLRALTLRQEHLPTPPLSPPPISISQIQNLHISMPPIHFGDHKGPNYEISRRTALQLRQFSGTDIRRRMCHFDLQDWTLSKGMARVLCGFGGFDVVRVEVRLKPYGSDPDGRIRPYDSDREDEQREECVQLIEERLGPALGNAKWEGKDSGTCFEQVLIAVFWPRESGK